jgi:hypothetical protein
LRERTNKATTPTIPAPKREAIGHSQPSAVAVAVAVVTPATTAIRAVAMLYFDFLCWIYGYVHAREPWYFLDWPVGISTTRRAPVTDAPPIWRPDTVLAPTVVAARPEENPPIGPRGVVPFVGKVLRQGGRQAASVQPCSVNKRSVPAGGPKSIHSPLSRHKSTPLQQWLMDWSGLHETHLTRLPSDKGGPLGKDEPSRW